MTGKGSKTRIVPVERARPRRARRMARDSRNPRPALRDGALRGAAPGALTPREVQRRIKRWAAAAGLEVDVHPHMLRHSFASARAAIVRRPARGAGNARPREHRLDAGLHAPRFPAPREGVRAHPARSSAPPAKKALRPHGSARLTGFLGSGRRRSSIAWVAGAGPRAVHAVQHALYPPARGRLAGRRPWHPHRDHRARP